MKITLATLLFALAFVPLTFAQSPSCPIGVVCTVLPNDTATGTTQYSLVKKTAAGAAVVMATTDTKGYVGVCMSNCGKLGTALIAIEGTVPVNEDGATTVNDYVQISSTTGGNVHDAGSAYPTSGDIIGAVQTAASTGQALITLFPPEIQGSSGGGGGATAWSAIGNPTGNLSLTMGSFTSTFNYTGSINQFTLANSTAATSSQSQSSPFYELQGNYWNGTASASDTWGISTTIANGTNGSSYLTFSHIGGTSGATGVQVPGAVSTPNGVNAYYGCGSGGASQCNVSVTAANGGNVSILPNGGGLAQINLGGSATSSANVSYGSASPTVDALKVQNSSSVPMAGIGFNGSFDTYITNSATGTTVNTLTILSGAGAQIAATTNTSGVIGITVGGAGTTGTAVVAISGQAKCAFDGATTAWDYVQISSGTAGDCHDAGATKPASNEIIGRVLSSNGAAGTYVVLIELENE